MRTDKPTEGAAASCSAQVPVASQLIEATSREQTVREARERYSSIAMAALLLAWPGLALSQSGITANENYDPHIRHRTLVSAVDGELAFGDRTDVSTGATSFYVTVLSVPGNNELEVALRYKYVRQRSYFANTTAFTWERDDPYITGDFGKAAGWVLGNEHVPSTSRTTARCSMPTGHATPPVLPSDNGRPGEYYPSEYWSGYRLVLPRGKVALVNPLANAPAPPAVPSSGGPYKWATNDGWFFSCIPLINGTGEGFLARAPDGTRYFFDDLRPGPELAPIDKYNSFGQDITFERQEIRIYASRIEDRFGNHVEGLSGNDGRTISVTTSGSSVQASFGGRQWSVSVGNPFVITYPDGSRWQLQSTWSMSPTAHNYDGPGQHCAATNPPASMSGSGIITVTLPSGATGTFSFSPVVRGYSYVPLRCATPDGMNSPYIIDPSRFTEVSLTRKSVSGPGITPYWSQMAYGPPNDCYGGGYRTTCTASSPTTVTTTVSRSDGTTTVHTFGNRYMVNQGLQLGREERQGASQVLATEQNEWALFDGIGLSSLGQYSQAGSLGSIKRSALSKRTVTQQGHTFVWRVATDCGSGASACFDSHARPTRIVRSSQPAP